jgi:hypothetical protein
MQGAPKSQIAHGAFILPRDRGLTRGVCCQRGGSEVAVLRHACASGQVEVTRCFSGPARQAVG